MTVSFEGKTLTIDDMDHEMEQPIRDTIELEDRIVVLLDDEAYPDGDPNEERNVLAVSKSGEMLWRIVRAPMRRGGEKSTDMNPYTGIWFRDDGKSVLVGDWGGCDYDLDTDTGEVSNAIFTR